jgi:hypothetical protein
VKSDRFFFAKRRHNLFGAECHTIIAMIAKPVKGTCFDKGGVAVVGFPNWKVCSLIQKSK